MQSVKTWMLAAFVLQNVVSMPIRIGNFARQLTSQDLTTLEQLATAGGAKGGAPWLLEGPFGQIGNSIRMYLLADSQTAQLRRGKAIEGRRAQNGWVVVRTVEFAQVVESGKDFNSLTGDTDVHRPFVVSGVFSDDELISLVTLIRTSPDKVEGNWPITSLRREDPNSVALTLVKSDRTGFLQMVSLVRQGPTWRVTEARTGVA